MGFPSVCDCHGTKPLGVLPVLLILLARESQGSPGRGSLREQGANGSGRAEEKQQHLGDQVENQPCFPPGWEPGARQLPCLRQGCREMLTSLLRRVPGEAQQKENKKLGSFGKLWRKPALEVATDETRCLLWMLRDRRDYSIFQKENPFLSPKNKESCSISCSSGRIL